MFVNKRICRFELVVQPFFEGTALAFFKFFKHCKQIQSRDTKKIPPFPPNKKIYLLICLNDQCCWHSVSSHLDITQLIRL